MKKSILVVSITIAALLLFLGTQLLGSYFDRKNDIPRIETDYYKERIAAEENAKKLAASESKSLLRELNEGNSLNDVREEIEKGLLYCFENFDEFKKDDNAELEIINKLVYSITLPYYAAIQSDTDQRNNSDLENKLRNTTVFQYADKALQYADDCNSLTSKDTDYMIVKELEKKIESNLTEEVDIFLESLRTLIAD